MNKTANMKEYKLNYYKEHKHYWESKFTCISCNVSFKISNKSNHERTNKHKMNEALYIQKQLNIAIIKTLKV